AGLMATILIASALRIRDMEILLPLVAFASLALLAAWHQPVLMQARHNIVSDGDVIATLNVPVLPPEFALFSAVALIIAAGFGAAGYLGLRRSRLPGLWAGISAAVPLSALIIAYWRMDAHAPDMAWGGIAMALAILATAAASRVVRHREQPGMDTALGLYVLAVIAAISLAAAMTLEKTWLSIALAVQLPATAWVHNRLHIAFLRPAAAAIALAVGLRLVLLHHLPGTPLQVQLDAFWILYSYGLPALMFAIAARWFRRTADDRLVTILESGTIAITVALISMEIRHFAGDGTLGYRSYGLLEQSLHSISWLATGFGLYVRHRFSARPIDLSAAQILMGLAGLQVFGLQVLLSNPLLSGEDVGAWPLVNLLFLAYVVPALFALAIHFEAQRRGERLPANLAAAAFFVLLFVYGTLEVRHLFHGSVLTAGAMTNAEGYAYSVLWLVYAGALLAAGMARRIAMLRYASLGLVLMVVAKVFLWDMSWLTGLYRVASFLGLGFSLVAIGYFYQRFVLRPGADKAESSAGPDPASSEPPDTPVDDR
ncbi:MAG: DUF2339 domain-containing protein, partial [Rhodospirillales bacterium]|nr:DUF2339 domain-containing protein [Rhodospirillales bacterium]